MGRELGMKPAFEKVLAFLSEMSDEELLILKLGIEQESLHRSNKKKRELEKRISTEKLGKK